MKAGWEIKKLADVCIVERGSSPRPIETYLTDKPNGVNWIKIGDTKNVEKYIHTTQQKITPEGAQKSRFVDVGDLILSNSMSYGKPYIMKTQGYIHDGWFVLRLPNYLDTEYFWYLLSSPYVVNQFERLASGAIVKNISSDLVKRVDLPIPPIEEQRRITAVLDEALAAVSTAVDNTARNRQNAQTLFDSYLHSIFANHAPDWEEKTVGQVSQHSLGKMLDKQKNQGTKKKYLRNFNVRWFDFDLSDVSEMRFLEEETEKYTAVKGDLLICEGGYPGRAAIWEKDHPIHFQKAIHRVRFHIPEHAKWFLYFLYLSDRTKEIKKHFTGTGIQHFTGSSLHHFTFPVAPLPEIKTIVMQLDDLTVETQRLEAIYQQKLAALNELKQALLHQAFSGNL